ncbi:MAG: hypothetical protein J7K66_01415 [Anaerolineaceae bacterium]|nr:hypothetical protein [Anaerolineaceae bacterium]
MNKTVKTIAWICLVLGLLGVAVEVGAYVRAQSFVAHMRETIRAGEIPAFKGHFADIDADGDIDKEDWEKAPFYRSKPFAFTGMMDGRRAYNALPVGHIGLVFLPFLLLASGPVLTVVGAVTLIVNREQKAENSKKKEDKNKKK